MKARRLAALVFIAALTAVGGVAATPSYNPAEAVPPESSSDVKTLSLTLIGDSYSAGNGAGDYETQDDPAYFRSPNNWANAYTGWLNGQGVHSTLTNLARSGATTDDVKNLQLPDVSVSSDVVMLTVGGNDVKFEEIVTLCFASGVREAAPCEALLQRAAFDFDGVIDNTTAIFEGLQDKLSPDAQVILTAYPLLSADVDDYILSGCSLEYWQQHLGKPSAGLCGQEDRIYFDAAAEVRTLGRYATTRQAQLVNSWNASNRMKVTFVDSVPERFAGHEPNPHATVRNPYRWINEFLETEGDVGPDGKTKGKTSFTKQNFYHPNKIGHREIAAAINAKVGIPDSVRTVGAASENVDIVFAIDATGSMTDYIDAVRDNVAEIARQVDEMSASARFALVTYKDHPEAGGDFDDYPSRVDLDFTTDIDLFRSGLGDIDVSGGGDIPESAYSGIMAGLNLEWRPGVRKILIAMGDAPAKDPEPVTGYTWRSVARRAFEVDPVVIYGIDNSNLTSPEFTSLVEETGGAIIPGWDSTDIPAAITGAIGTEVAKPFGWIQGPIHATIGEAVELDARGSYGVGVGLVEYEWDLDGDGVYDQMGSEALITHTFTEEFTGVLGVRVTDENGQRSLGSTTLVVSAPLPDPGLLCPGLDDPDLTDFERAELANACFDLDLPTEEQPGVYVVDEIPVDPSPTPSTPTPTPTSTTPTPTPTPSTPTPTPTSTTPTPTPTPSTPTPTSTTSVNVYITPGLHFVNGRTWMTACEPYSATHRCWTNIWATTVKPVGSGFAQYNGWVFNNLTYLPAPRSLWAGNPLGHTGSWTATDGRSWRTECDTAATGGNGCRSYVRARVVEYTGSGYRIVTKEVFNNIVMFK